MTPDQIRLETNRAAPRIVALQAALSALRSPIMFVQSGAHPDDETSTLLAALRFRDGMNLGYICSTRGEGGQNDIGRATGAALGTLRTAEMEAAAARLDMRVRWMTPDPSDPLHDFGFSKSGEETLDRWGRDRTLDRFALAIRALRPDILCPTFLDVPGQHGHHRAMTLLAPEAIARASDRLWQPDIDPWSVAKLYLPAWSGAGQAYDDDLPPPPATVTVPGKGRDPTTGHRWAEIGQQSRAMHRTQGMGHWPGPDRDFPLHLVGGSSEASIAEGLPATWADLGWPDGAVIDACIDRAAAALTDPEAVWQNLSEALRLIPDDAGHTHRAARLRNLVTRALWLASGAVARGWPESETVAPEVPCGVTLETEAARLDTLAVTLSAPDDWHGDDRTLRTMADTAPDPYPAAYDPLDPPLPALAVHATRGDVALRVCLPLDRTPVALPPTVTLTPQSQAVNLATGTRTVPLRIDGTLLLPDGWAQDGATLTLPEDVETGLHAFTVMRHDVPALLVEQVRAPHIAPRVVTRPASARVALLDVALPRGRIGYIGGGADRVDGSLREIGADVTALDPSAIDDGLPGIDTLVLGVFALRFRDGLATRLSEITEWVRNGGTLLTLYHRPWDNWDADALPARLDIGQPSLRWRVTDPEAAVAVLAPDHPILTGPNPIGPEDWAGWHKERGLYFAATRDPAYTPLLSMSDPGEAPLDGALVSGGFGRGRHTHCALILHHQMNMLVPGAFRLMANLCDPRRL